ncbi:hypothetical protein LINPERPRIM_LOCUS14950 [Linum perenne]
MWLHSSRHQLPRHSPCPSLHLPELKLPYGELLLRPWISLRFTCLHLLHFLGG